MVFEFLDEIHDALFLFGFVAGLAATLDQYVASVLPIPKFENVALEYRYWKNVTLPARWMFNNPYAARVTGIWVS
jgi:hypothetical protein